MPALALPTQSLLSLGGLLERPSACDEGEHKTNSKNAIQAHHQPSVMLQSVRVKNSDVEAK
jgi:hypothetical protein